MDLRDDKTITVYSCGVDWQHELGEAADGNKVYASVEDLKENNPCWKKCGIVEIQMNLVRWVNKQKF